jgi:ubiquinone biosynthesis protein UbiJ
MDDKQLRLAQNFSKEADATFTGSLPSLMSLLLQKHPNLHGSGVEVEGDMQKAQAIQKILSASSIDWEYHFSRLFGDIPVQTASDFAHKTVESTRRNLDSLKKNLDEYIHEEARLLPGKEELEIFYSDLDALKLRLDRLQARINCLSA